MPIPSVIVGQRSAPSFEPLGNPLIYAGASAIWSLHSIGDPAAPVVRVRRSSDSAEADFTAAQITDGTLGAFCGAASGYVRTWYDQSPSGHHLEQSTAASQPQLVDSGVILDAPLFDGSNDYMEVADPILGETFLAACVFSPATDDHIGGLWNSVDTGGSVNNRIVHYADTRTSPRRIGNYAPDGTGRLIDLLAKLDPGGLHLQVLAADGTAMTASHDGVSQGSVTQGGTTAALKSFQLGRQHTALLCHAGMIYELVLYPAPDAARAAREADIAARYGIILAT